MKLTLLLVVPLLGCASPEAPDELSDLTRFFIRELVRADDALLADGLANFEAVMADVDLRSTNTLDRAWAPDDLHEDDVWDTEHPDIPADRCVPIAVARRSDHGIDLHLRSLVEPDQASAQPSAETYDRELIEGDADCFVDGSCTFIDTTNAITRSNPIYSVDYTMPKEYRRLEMEDGRVAVVGRSWLDRSWQSTNSDAELILSWVADVYIDGPDGILRYEAVYSHTFIPGADDTTIANTVRTSTNDTLEAEDQRITDLYLDR